MDEKKLKKEVQSIGIIGFIAAILIWFTQPAIVFWQAITVLVVGIGIIYLRAIHEEMATLNKKISELGEE